MKREKRKDVEDVSVYNYAVAVLFLFLLFFRLGI